MGTLSGGGSRQAWAHLAQLPPASALACLPDSSTQATVTLAMEPDLCCISGWGVGPRSPCTSVYITYQGLGLRTGCLGTLGNVLPSCLAWTQRRIHPESVLGADGQGTFCFWNSPVKSVSCIYSSVALS